jgi:hypothetical protein
VPDVVYEQALQLECLQIDKTATNKQTNKPTNNNEKHCNCSPSLATAVVFVCLSVCVCECVCVCRPSDLIYIPSHMYSHVYRSHNKFNQPYWSSCNGQRDECPQRTGVLVNRQNRPLLASVSSQSTVVDPTRSSFCPASNQLTIIAIFYSFFSLVDKMHAEEPSLLSHLDQARTKVLSEGGISTVIYCGKVLAESELVSALQVHRTIVEEEVNKESVNITGILMGQVRHRFA